MAVLEKPGDHLEGDKIHGYYQKEDRQRKSFQEMIEK